MTIHGLGVGSDTLPSGTLAEQAILDNALNQGTSLFPGAVQVAYTPLTGAPTTTPDGLLSLTMAPDSNSLNYTPDPIATPCSKTIINGICNTYVLLGGLAAVALLVVASRR